VSRACRRLDTQTLRRFRAKLTLDDINSVNRRPARGVTVISMNQAHALAKEEKRDQGRKELEFQSSGRPLE